MLIETQTNRKVRDLITDNGLEFWNKQFDELCARNGILRHKTIRNTPQQNGLATRINRTLSVCFFYSKLPKPLWAEALNTSCYFVNKSPSTTLNFKTPDEIWPRKLANYLNLKVFGCIAYAHTKQGKLEPRAFKCAFLGYFEWVKGYKFWYTNFQPLRCIISKDMIFIKT